MCAERAPVDEPGVEHLPPGTGRQLSHDDAWLLAVAGSCAVALVLGCLAVTAAIRDLQGDTGPVVAAVRGCTATVLVVGAVALLVWRHVARRRWRELVGAQGRFRAVYGASPAGIVETDLEHRVVNCNPAFAAMIGLRTADVVGHHGWEFFHADSPPSDVAAVEGMVAGTRASYSAVRLLRAPDGSPLTVKLDWAAITDAAGAVTHLACIVTDISEQARTTAELVRARERAEVLWQQAPVGVIEGSPDGIITSVNDAMAQMLGHQPHELVGTRASDLADPEYLPDIVAGVALLSNGTGYVAERRYRTSDGRSLPVLVSTAALHDETGQVERFAGVVLDMSELHAQRAELAAARDELARRQSFTDALLETIDVGIVSSTVDGSHVSRNRAQREILGVGTDDATSAGMTVTAGLDVRLLDGTVVEPADHPLSRALDGRGSSLEELLIGPPGGPHRQLVVRTSTITSPDGALLGAVSALSDVTAERAAARELDEERSRLVEAQQLGKLGSFTLHVATQTFTFSAELRRIWGVAEGVDLWALRAELVHPDDLQEVARVWQLLLSHGGRRDVTHRIVRPDGGVRHLQVHLDAALGQDGTVVLVRGTHLDVTDLAAARLEAAAASALMSAVLAATPDFTFVTDVRTGAVVYAPPGKEILGITSEALVEHGVGVIAAIVHPDDQQRLRAVNVAAGDLGDGELLQIRYRVRATDASWHWLSRRVTPFRRDESGQVVEVLGVVRDVTDVVEAENRLEHSALHDHLTGLPNRALLMDRLEAALHRAVQTGREVAVLFFDLDGFKRVNDTAGHGAGDAVLVETTRRMREVLREHDTVARVGGDEFVVVVEPWQRDGAGGPVDDRALAVELAGRLATALRQPVEVDAVEHVVTASIGITYAGLVTVQADDVLRDADAAMYRAKHSGKDRYEVFEDGLRTDLAERGRVEQVLRRALVPSTGSASTVPAPRGGPTFTAAYQPVVDAGTGDLVGFEALARLTDADGVAIPPDVFIPVAESTALIQPLGSVMLDRACGQLARWRGQMRGLEHVTMAVNVSALQAQHTDLLAVVRRSLCDHGLAPHDLVLELTETSLLQAGHSTLSALRALRADGVGIAIDDFGTGYASLRYLATLPVSAVKVDRSFTAGLPHDLTCRTIVRAVVGLAADLHLGCVVEGVETVAQRAALPPGVHLQGWLTGRPSLDLDVAALLSAAV